MSGDSFSRRYSIIAETRRRWSQAEKESIFAEAERPDANISAVARRHGIKPSLLFRWRRLTREVQACSPAPAFVPVTLALPPACTETAAPENSPAISSNMAPVRTSAERPTRDDCIEIELGNGRLVRVGMGIDTDVLKRIVDLLDRPASNNETAGGRQGR
jgi:transposase